MVRKITSLIFTCLVVAVPSSQFEFELSNTTVGQLDVKKSSVLGINIGYTRVTLVDKRILYINHYSKSVLRGFEITIRHRLQTRGFLSSCTCISRFLHWIVNSLCDWSE